MAYISASNEPTILYLHTQITEGCPFAAGSDFSLFLMETSSLGGNLRFPFECTLKLDSHWLRTQTPSRQRTDFRCEWVRATIPQADSQIRWIRPAEADFAFTLDPLRTTACAGGKKGVGGVS